MYVDDVDKAPLPCSVLQGSYRGKEKKLCAFRQQHHAYSNILLIRFCGSNTVAVSYFEVGTTEFRSLKIFMKYAV